MSNSSDNDGIVSNLLNRIKSSAFQATAASGYSIVMLCTLGALHATSGSDGVRSAVMGFFAAGFWDTVGSPLFTLLRKGGSDGDSDNDEFVRLFSQFEHAIQGLAQASLDQIAQLSKQLETHTRVIGTALQLHTNSIDTTIRESIQRVLDRIEGEFAKQPVEETIAGASGDETLILIAKFRGQQPNDAPLVLSDQIGQICKQLGIKRVRVETIANVLGAEDDGIALGLLLKLNASLIIWGRDTTSGVEIAHLRRVHVDGLFFATQELINPRAPEFFVEMNHKMPSLLVGGALATVCDTLCRDERYNDVVQLVSKIAAILQKNVPVTDSALVILTFSYENAGFAYWATGQFRKAVEAFSSSIETDKSLGRPRGLPHMNRAVNHGRMGNYLLAQSDFNVAESLVHTMQDKASSLYFNMAVSFSDRGLYERALLYYAKADSEMDGIYVEAVHNHGILLLKLDRYREAIEQFSRVIDTIPNHPYAYLNRASAHIELGQYQLAIEDCTTAIDQGTSEHLLYRNRCKARFRLYEKDTSSSSVAEIEADLDASTQLGKNLTADDLLWFGAILYQIGRTERALDYFVKCLRTAPSQVQRETARRAIHEIKRT